MKTIPVVPVGCGDMQNTLLRWQIRQSMNKTKGLVAIIPKQEEKTTEEIIAERLEEDSEKYLKLIIQFYKELFNSDS